MSQLRHATQILLANTIYTISGNKPLNTRHS